MVVYPWHPWYGQMVQVVREVSRRSGAAVECRELDREHGTIQSLVVSILDQVPKSAF